MLSYTYQLKKINQKEILLIIFLSMIYAAISISCDPLFYRQTTIFGITFTAAAFLYTGLYAISDSLARLGGSSLAVIIILFDKVSDGLYSYLNYFASQLPMPQHFIGTGESLTKAVNTLGPQLPPLYYNGIFISIIASIIEVVIFTKLYRRINNFFLATITSITITLFLHDIPSDYLTLRHLPNVWQIVWGNYIVCMFCALIITLFLWCILKLAISKKQME